MKRLKILFAGGGTGGSVTPLLAVFEELQKRGYARSRQEVLWIGTRNGVESRLLEGKDLKFQAIFSGKLRRYISIRNFVDPIFIFLGFLQSFYHIIRFWPSVIVVAGGFVGVPVVWAGWILRRKILIHQQDIRKGLANRLMAPFADRITVTFESSLKEFSKKKAVLTGNPVRENIFLGSKTKAVQTFSFEENLFTVLILGGGTGSLFFNTLVSQTIEELVKFCQVIHIAGAGREVPETETLSKDFSRYHQYPVLINEMPEAYAAADLVVCRAGLSTLTEISVLKKSAIVLPIPQSHQEENAQFFALHNAVRVADERDIAPEGFISAIKTLLENEAERETLSENAGKMMGKDGRERVVGEVIKISNF